MKIDDIFALWEKDSKIDQANLAFESLNIPTLHHKYYKIFLQERMLLKQLETKYAELYKLKKQYYLGTLSEDELKENGWEPNRLRILRDDVESFIQADKQIVEMSLKVGLQQEKISFLDSIIRSLNSRNYLIKNALDWLNFSNGVK